MTNVHRRFLGFADLRDILRRVGIDSPITGQSLLAGGTFNSVYRLSFANRPNLVLKLSTGAMTSRWGEAFVAMLKAVLDDADRYRAVLPVDPQQVRRAVVACGNDLARVLVPSLVHFDLWEGNILLDLEGDPRISGLIDGERAMWGDPVVDFASVSLFGEIRDDKDFIRGYEMSGTVMPLDPSARRRLLLYRIYLGLIMIVEPIPRGTGQASGGHAGIVTERLTADLAELEQLS